MQSRFCYVEIASSYLLARTVGFMLLVDNPTVILFFSGQRDAYSQMTRDYKNNIFDNQLFTNLSL